MRRLPLRTKYLLGDWAATALAGACILPLAAAALPCGWPMAATMPLGMALGMAASFPFWAAAAPALGAIEPMIHIMLGGMTAGMAAPMLSAACADPGPAPLAATGAICGTAASAFVAASDWALRRKEPDA